MGYHLSIPLSSSHIALRFILSSTDFQTFTLFRASLVAKMHFLQGFCAAHLLGLSLKICFHDCYREPQARRL